MKFQSALRLPWRSWSPLALAVAALLLAGCATHSVNPPQARAQKGYVDFHTDSAGELDWEVSRFDARAQKFTQLFVELDARPERILRLEMLPGHHRLRVRFMNVFIRTPAVVEVEVVEGKIVPVEVVLKADGTADVQRKEVRLGSTARGRYGRSTKYTSSEQGMYEASARALPPLPYAVQEQMPYAILEEPKP